MIGVLSKPGETAVVEEFFQLFKTPWEFFQTGRPYDVLLATADDLPEMNAKAVLIFASSPKAGDIGAGIATQPPSSGDWVDYDGLPLPIYRRLLTFGSAETSILRRSANSAVVGLELPVTSQKAYRFGYDLFDEIAFLLTTGQPMKNARVPALDIHIMLVRNCILNAGICLLEIPPVPAGSEFMACLSHDIDFLGIRNHKLDHTMWGFLFRSTVGACWNFLQGKILFSRLCMNWRAALSLPFVHLGWVEDFWQPFAWYLHVEKDIPATYFLIPFKHRAGEKVPASNPARRSAPYDITDIPQWTTALTDAGCEIGAHGIDAWHSVEKGREELARVAAITKESAIGIRMHWLLRDENTFRVLEQAGFAYDSTSGYNDTVGYRSGTTQVFRPLAAHTLLELPLHIQDGALFYPQKLDLSEPEAWDACQTMIENSRQFGGVLTILWHDRSPGPERFWGTFYARLVQELRSRKVWFGSGARIVNWFRNRRQVVFERDVSDGENLRVRLAGKTGTSLPPFILRVYVPCAAGLCQSSPGQFRQAFDLAWTGEEEVGFDELLRKASARSMESPAGISAQG